MKNLTKHTLFTPYLLLAVFASLFTACREDEAPEPDHDHELITTVVLTLTNTADATEVVTATWRDLDGPGGAAPTIEELDLVANTTYRASIGLLHEHVHGDHSDSEDLTGEIVAEADDHEFFYTPSAGLNLTVTKTDADEQGRPVGLEATFVTGTQSHGSLRVRLLHQPGIKPTPGSPSVGETDVDIIIPIHIH